MSGRIFQRAAVSVAVVLMAGCATTVDVDGDDAPDDPAASLSEAELTGGEGRELAEDDTSPLDTGVIVDSEAPATTIPVVGSASDLLPEIGIEMSRLSAQIADDGDEDATITQIEAQWAAITDEVAETHPQLVPGIQATIDMARNAVDTNRPADGDKAFSILTDLIDDYTGDS